MGRYNDVVRQAFYILVKDRYNFQKSSPTKKYPQPPKHFLRAYRLKINSNTLLKLFAYCRFVYKYNALPHRSLNSYQFAIPDVLI